MIRNTRMLKGFNTYSIVACHQYGEPNQKVVRPKPIVKINCKAILCAKRVEDDNKWCATQFDNKHSLNSSPSRHTNFVVADY